MTFAVDWALKANYLSINHINKYRQNHRCLPVTEFVKFVMPAQLTCAVTESGLESTRCSIQNSG